MCVTMWVPGTEAGSMGRAEPLLQPPEVISGNHTSWLFFCLTEVSQPSSHHSLHHHYLPLLPQIGSLVFPRRAISTKYLETTRNSQVDYRPGPVLSPRYTSAHMILIIILGMNIVWPPLYSRKSTREAVGPRAPGWKATEVENEPG